MIVLHANVSAEREEAIAFAAWPCSALGPVRNACGMASPLAWRFLMPGADCFMTIEDEDAVEGMQVLAKANDIDPPIVAGASGAAGLAGLVKSMRDRDLADELALGHVAT